jgi:hypothetical protein
VVGEEEGEGGRERREDEEEEREERRETKFGDQFEFEEDCF